MAGAEWIWLERWLGNSPTGPDAWAQWTIGQCGELRQLRAQWRQVGFRRLNGEAYSLPLVEQMQHVVNHATLHRGQAVGMIRQLGIVPPTTDLLSYLMVKPQ
ncbi:MAG: hypothetical protein HYY94_04740 [Gemmatimonadetes bacterium]|nr:hypothetical protein [Gemmatimonadota bacterium]